MLRPIVLTIILREYRGNKITEIKKVWAFEKGVFKHHATFECRSDRIRTAGRVRSRLKPCYSAQQPCPGREYRLQ